MFALAKSMHTLMGNVNLSPDLQNTQISLPSHKISHVPAVSNMEVIKPV